MRLRTTLHHTSDIFTRSLDVHTDAQSTLRVRCTSLPMLTQAFVAFDGHICRCSHKHSSRPWTSPQMHVKKRNTTRSYNYNYKKLQLQLQLQEAPNSRERNPYLRDVSKTVSTLLLTLLQLPYFYPTASAETLHCSSKRSRIVAIIQAAYAHAHFSASNSLLFSLQWLIFEANDLLFQCMYGSNVKPRKTSLNVW